VNISVFLADDHELVREGLRALLESHKDMKVVGGVGDGKEAVKQVLALRPDVVLMDIAMPGLNGIEATRQIATQLAQTRVIMLSMYSTSEYIFRSLKAGAQGYILKESAGGDVVNAVRAVYIGKKYLSSKITEKVLDDYLHQYEQLDSESLLARLSRRERQILQFVVEGKSSSDIAGELLLSAKTVETYRSRLMKKLGVSDVPGLVKFAFQQGIPISS
jgi:DNA-binding NarL/FixJ family response regulator